jgi:dipeptidyl aminopeptidase/acylaminoacyl peptidase
MVAAVLILGCMTSAAPSSELVTEQNLAGRRGITPEDYFSFQFADDPRLSPDGKLVAYVRTVIDQKTCRRESAIWLVPVNRSVLPRRLSAEGFNSHKPRWNPDVEMLELAYLSSKNPDVSASDRPCTVSIGGGAEEPSSRTQIYLQQIDRGEARALTKSHDFRNGLKEYQWSPDKTRPRIVAVSLSGPSDRIASADRKSDVRHYTHTRYKDNDTGWFDDKRRHLWIVDVLSAAAEQITNGQDWNDDDPQWSPDGKRIAFVSHRTGKAFDGGDNSDIWVIPATGGEPIKISDHPFQDEQPRWSPDGKQIVFTGKTQHHQFPKLYIAPSSGGIASQLVAGELDLIPKELHWLPPSTLLFSAADKGETHIFRVDLAASTPSAITSGPRAVHSFDVNHDAGVMAYLVNDFCHLNDLYVSGLDGANERRLTELNADLWSQIQLQTVEHLPYNSTDGWPVDGFFVKPVGWQPGKKYPMVLVIHGGPQSMFGVDWHHEFQVYAAKGWAVFFSNPRGSAGYGEKFERGIINNYGGMDYEDVMAGVKAALEKYPWIDRDKLGVTGGSYGGFLTNWIVSHTDRFKAAVTLRSLSNFISDEGTSDGLYGEEDYFEGKVYEKFDYYWDRSPLKYAHAVKTPTLILHSDMDFRVALEQAEQWFRALQYFGVVSELVVFPGENHNLTRTGRPKHLVETLNWQAYWFDRHLNGNPNAKPPNAP